MDFRTFLEGRAGYMGFPGSANWLVKNYQRDINNGIAGFRATVDRLTPAVEAGTATEAERSEYAKARNGIDALARKFNKAREIVSYEPGEDYRAADRRERLARAASDKHAFSDPRFYNAWKAVMTRGHVDLSWMSDEDFERAWDEIIVAGTGDPYLGLGRRGKSIFTGEDGE